ncbi:MAG: efflux RND transporter periplasmic adaptor subunit, partial [Acidobacteria bacterium]
MANGNGKNKRRKRIFIIGGAIGLVIAILIFVGWAVDGNTAIDKSKLGEVKRETIDKNVVATGKVEPITKAEIKSKASGIVKRILVDAGQKVKAGQVLMEVDREEIQARVRQARAQLAGAEANLAVAKADSERAKLDAEGPDVPLLKRNYERAQQMAREGVFSEAQLDDAEKNYQMAKNKQDVAKANLLVSKSKFTQ